MTPGQTLPQGPPWQEKEEEDDDDVGESEHCLASVRPHGVTRPTVRYQLSGEQR